MDHLLRFERGAEAIAALFNPLCDSVMGGSSTASVSAQQDPAGEHEHFLRIRGELVTAGGGFAGAAVKLPQQGGTEGSGGGGGCAESRALQICGRAPVGTGVDGVVGNSEGRTWKVVLQSATTGRLSYQCAFEPPAEWGVVELPFSSFVPSVRGRHDPDAPPLDTASLSTFGVRCSVFGQPTDGGRGRRDEAAMPGLFTLDLLWVRSVL